MSRNERSVNQTLRQQQDEAYLQSLRADQEKARKRREEEERKQVKDVMFIWMSWTTIQLFSFETYIVHCLRLWSDTINYSEIENKFTTNKFTLTHTFPNQQRAAEEAARKAAEEVLAAERRQQEKLELARQVPPEPAKDDVGAIQVALRLPSGKRIDRRFLQTHSMKVSEV